MLQRQRCERQLFTVLQKVDNLFESEPMTINSDKFLIVRYLQVYHNDPSLNQILRDKTIPSFDSITRCGRKLRSLGKYNADGVVEEGRAENEVAYSNVFS